MLGLKRGTVKLCGHDTAWEQNAAETIIRLKAVLGGAACDIQHVGSTAVTGILAKPIIDIAAAVSDFGEVMRLVPALERAGFMYQTQDTAEDMLFVSGDLNADTRTHHIHLVRPESRQWHDYLHFRDYLNAKPDTAKAYEALKLGLMRAYKADRLAYTEGKAAFIGRTLRKARAWSMLGRLIAVTIERPLGSVHQQDGGRAYPLFCGHADGGLSPEDEKIGVYVLAESMPQDIISGRVIALVHCQGEADSKVFAVPDGIALTQGEVYSAVSFHERGHDIAIEMFEPNIIHILGASGAGTTTLGKAICEKFNYSHLDADDYFWLPTDPAYTTKRALFQRQKLLGEAIASQGRCVISGSLCGWGDMFMPKFGLVILVETPTEIRLERLKLREYNHFGHRILPGGDMYENHTAFLAWAAKYDTAGEEQRSRALHARWLRRVYCPVVQVDGTRPVQETLAGLSSVIR